MQRLRYQTTGLEGQTARACNLVVVPVVHSTKLGSPLVVLLLQTSNYADGLGLGRLGGTLLPSQRRLQGAYPLAQEVVLRLYQCQLGLGGAARSASMSASRSVRACRSELLISMKATGSKSNLSGELSFRYMRVKQIVSMKY
jgi:hypothetical protein